MWSADSYQSNESYDSICSSETSDQAPLPLGDDELASLAQQQLTQLHVLFQQGVLDLNAFSHGRRKVLKAISEGTAAINVTLDKIEPSRRTEGARQSSLARPRPYQNRPVYSVALCDEFISDVPPRVQSRMK